MWQILKNSGKNWRNGRQVSSVVWSFSSFWRNLWSWACGRENREICEKWRMLESLMCRIFLWFCSKMVCADALKESLEESYFCRELKVLELLLSCYFHWCQLQTLSPFLSHFCLSMSSFYLFCLRVIDPWVEWFAGWVREPEIQQTAWRKPTGITEKIKKIFSINKPSMHMHVCVMGRLLVSYKHPVISWFIYLKLTCVTFGCTVPRWRWGFLVGSVNVGVYGKENSRLILFERVLGVCVSLSQTYCRGNRPCFVRAGGEVGSWGCHSTYSCSNWNVQTFRPGATAPSPLWVPCHWLFLTHTYWCYLNQSRYFAKKPPSEGCICIAKVSVCLHVWMHNHTWMCNSDLTWLSWKVFDWMDSWTAHFTAVGHPDCPQVREIPT